MTTKVLLSDLIEEFHAAIKTRQPHLEISRKFTVLSRFLGPIELSGLREAQAYFETDEARYSPEAFDATFDFLVKRFAKVQVFI